MDSLVIPIMKTKNSKSAVLATLPSTGLCNKLFVWAKALVFAEINDMEMYCVGWTKPKIGTFIRKEKSNRLYLRQIKKQSFLNSLKILFRYSYSPKVYDPPVSKISDHDGRSVFVFRDLQANSNPEDPFRDLIDFRDFVLISLSNLIRNECRNQISESSYTPIAVHVRRGDFRHFDWWQPIENFCEILQNARGLAQECLPATVYSDGTLEDLKPLLEMPNVTLAPNAPDIVDLFRLSRSKVLITSRASTFSNWAAFMSDGMILRDPLFSPKPCRPLSLNEQWFEGVVPQDSKDWPSLAKKNLLAIGKSYREGD
jgi:hypothetical protein